MKKIIAFILLAVTLLSCPVYAVENEVPGITEATELPFTDVKESHWFYDEVVYAYENGIFDGVTPTTFEPNTAMTRAMFVQTLANIEDIDFDAYTGTDFTDVKESHWYAPAIKWAVDNKIVSGMGNGKFSPNSPLTRAQLAVMLYNYASYKGASTEAEPANFESFTDKDKTASWAKEAMIWVTSREIVTGVAEGILSPSGESTRAQVARMLMLFIEQEEAAIPHPETVDVGMDRQLFLDDYVIDTERSDFSITPEIPMKKEAVFTFDEWHETRDTVYHNITKMPDGTYRMYYKATQDSDGMRRICYIESTDGLTWTRPNLNYGTNIVTPDICTPDNLFVFYDTNPNCLEKDRIKGIYGQWGDGLFWEHTERNGDWFPFWPDETKLMGTPTETQGCYFDTLNTVHWDENRGQYVAFVRGFHTDDGNYNLDRDFVSGEETAQFCRRDIRVAYSNDLVNWTTPVPLQYNTTDDYQLYTNAALPYYRAPKTYVGMPTRFFESNGNYYTQVFFMSSRDTVNWTRTEEPYLTPENSQSYRYQRSGYPCIGYIETAPGEMSFYMKEKKTNNGISTLYRYTLRVDGFMSAQGKKLVTKPMTFEGESLELNYEGDVKVTLSDLKGNSITSEWLSGNEYDANISFNGNISDFKGKEVYLTFEMKDNAKLYSFKFN